MSFENWSHRFRQPCLVASLALVGPSLLPNHNALAQVIPDNTLENEGSKVIPLNPQTSRIDGGALRGNSLFHSFRNFSIPEGSGVFFANPGNVKTIFSRVTGGTPSEIYGKLGVLGTADLWLLNPSGILFGPKAQLDVKGSFIATTATSLQLPGGAEFSAINPQTPPLLEMNVSAPIGLQFEGGQPAPIINAGVLKVNPGQNLALAGGTVVSQGELVAPGGQVAVMAVAGAERTSTLEFSRNGQLQSESNISPVGNDALPTAAGVQPELAVPAGWVEQAGLTIDLAGKLQLGQTGIAVQAGDAVVRQVEAGTGKLAATGNLTLVDSQLKTTGDLQLLARDTVRVRDSPDKPFVAAVGGKLLVQGNQGVDIFALNHPQSGLASKRDMVLRSFHPVSGDAHYWVGGSFRIELPDGSLGSLLSLDDPVIRSLGDVSFDSYVGGSLHILAAGKVEIPSFVKITGSDAVNGLIETVTLSDGSSIPINGQNQPTLDIRAGVLSSKLGFSWPPDIKSSPTSADIKTGTILFTDSGGTFIAGTALLTNQYQPNFLLKGNIQISNTLGTSPLAIATGDFLEGGSVTIDSRGGITLSGIIDASPIPLHDGFSGNGGNIVLLANKDIILTPNSRILSSGLLGGDITLKTKEDIFATSSRISNSSFTNVANYKGGNVDISAKNFYWTQNSILSNSTFGQGNAGDINITAHDSVLIDRGSMINGVVLSGVTGAGGDINITAESLLLTNGSLISADTNGRGDGGDINITTTKLFSVNGRSSISASTTAQGNSGNLNITTELFSVSDRSLLSTGTLSDGKAGNLNIRTGELSLTHGSTLTTSDLARQGNGGNLDVNARGTVLLDGQYTTVGARNGGNINIASKSLSVMNGALVSNSTAGEKKAGNIYVTASNSVFIDGSSSSLFSQVLDGAKGDGGNINISTGSLSINNNALLSATTSGYGNAGNINLASGSLLVTNGAVISTSTLGQGNGGDINIDVRDTINLNGLGSLSFNGNNVPIPAYIVTSSLVQNVSGYSGDIAIKAKSLFMTDGSIISTNTLGNLDAGSISLKINDSIILADLSSIGSGVFPGGTGNANKIDIQTRSLSLISGGKITAGLAPQFRNLPGGRGKAGNIQINALDSVNISGVSANQVRLIDPFNPSVIVQTEGSSSGITASTESGAEGPAGNITINTKTFNVTDGAVVETFTANSGEAGNIIINANTFTAKNGGQLLATTFANGRAGDIILNVADSIALAGSDPTFNDRFARFGATTVSNQGSASGLFSNTGASSQRNGGGIFINSSPIPNQSILPVEHLAVTDKAQISVNSQGSGTGGNIKVNAQRINLDQGQITAETRSADGGDITLDVQQLLLMRHQSQISTNAGKGLSGGDGGNIRINASNGFIVAVPLENSDISANAFSGGGGKVEISARAIFGLVPRSRTDLEILLGTSDPQRLNPQDVSTSDITAISQQNPTLNGEVVLNSTINPNQGLTQVPKEPRATDIADSCQVSNGKEAVQFYDIGRGGLPPRPEDPLSMDLIEWHQPPTSKAHIPPLKPLTAAEASQTDTSASDHASFTYQASTAAPKLIPPCQSH